MQEVFNNIVEKFQSKIEALGGASGSNEVQDVAVKEIEWCKELVEKFAKEFATDTNVGTNGWIPCSERLPEDGDNRFYMCIVENHEEDLPMFCQYDEECGFGFYHDIYDEHTLGFVDSEFKTNEELGYEKVIAWQQRPKPYQPKGE